MTMDRNLLYRFFDGVSTPDEEKQLIEWIDRNSANEKIFNKQRKVYNTMLMMEAEDLSITRAPKARMFRFPRWSKELMRTAAAVLLTVGVGYYFLSDPQRWIEATDTSISVPTGQRIDLTLPDGTAVTVNGSSTITYPAIFSKNERRIRLSGEAYFAVTHDEEHPFVIETAKYDVEVLGTEFNVEAYEQEGRFVTSLVKGKVRVTGHDDPSESVLLTANQQARRTDGKLRVETIPAYEKFLWRDGLIAFHKASLAEMMTLFEKYFGVQIIFGTEALPAVTFSGKIRISEGVDHALWVLQQNVPFQYDKDTDTMIITIS